MSPFHRVYGGLVALASGGSLAAAFAASGDPGGVHPPLSLDGLVVFSGCSGRCDAVSLGHMLCHVFYLPPELDVSLSCCDDVSCWLPVFVWLCP